MRGLHMRDLPFIHSLKYWAMKDMSLQVASRQEMECGKQLESEKDRTGKAVHEL